MLTPEGGWDAGDVLHVLPTQVSHEDLMRLWDALDAGYRLSETFVVRTVRLERPDVPSSRVVLREFALGGGA